MSHAMILVHAGLSTLSNDIITKWIGPIFLVAVAAFAIIFIKDRAWMKLIGFVGIAAVVGVLVYGGDAMFGGSEKGLTKVAKDNAVKIQ